jgi:hypothetical protein
LKVSDEFTVPLCAVYHHHIHTTGKERDWWLERNIDPLKIANALGSKAMNGSAVGRELMHRKMSHLLTKRMSQFIKLRPKRIRGPRPFANLPALPGGANGAAHQRNGRLLQGDGAVAHREAVSRLARARSRCGRAGALSPGFLGSVIGMGVGDHDSRRIDPFLMVEPIRPTIDHYAHTAQPHQQGAVTKVAARPDLDLTAGA